MYLKFGKRLLDIVLAATGLILLSPVFLLVIVLIKIFDSGPAFFVQDRIGRNGVVFRFFKFRSMPVETSDRPSDELGRVNLSWIGKAIRRTNIDELPQLLNVIMGDMSMVGPRPPILSQKELVRQRRENGAIHCRPGLTGLAQLNSFDGMTASEKAIHDGAYARDISLVGDLGIVIRTFGYLLRRPPVY